MEPRRIEATKGQSKLLFLVAFLFVLLIAGRSIASYVIEYQWWKEMEQVPTWFSMLLYGTAPVAAAALIAAVLFWLAHARGLKFSGSGLGSFPRYTKLSVLAALVLGTVVASILIDNWTVVRYFGNRGVRAESPWRDPVFGNALSFYFFDLPFYSMLLRVLLAFAFLSGLIFWLSARLSQLAGTMSEWQGRGEIDIRDLGLSKGLESRFIRITAGIFLLGLALHYYLNRFYMLYDEHVFLVGVDYVSETISIPLLWAAIAASVLAAGFVWLGRWRFALVLPLVLIVQAVVPKLVNSLYVRPNEISIQRPYIQRHIQSTRTAFGLDRRAKEIEFPATMEARIDPSKHKALLDNVRLWDWRAFHDTVTQIQALRPYYVFADSDVDRYTINGQLRQVLLTPRELDIRQLPDARTRWINPHFIYTHGYGVVMAESSRITSDGLPSFMIKDAPPQITVPDVKITQPEIYYGEVTHEPIFVGTGQAEFNYPSGSDNVHSSYKGKGGFPITSVPMRLAAAIAEGDWNIMLTNLLSGDSRMMIRRKVVERVDALAGFLTWDSDPYMVIDKQGRLVWLLDGYTTSQEHPYSRSIQMQGLGRVNYARNSVKATIDAYDGKVNLYIFEPDDPIIRAYAQLFPKLFQPATAMPADLREHARYPEILFRAQAEAYRSFHMKDPEAFYNKEDLWDVAKSVSGQSGKPEIVAPTYVVATLPGSEVPEFLLMIPFTPRTKDNLIGLMVARCDGPNLGELVFLQLSKQALVFGPMQIEARINQDQLISKDLSLWNQQGSQVLRGQMLILPIENTFLYVEPMYIQASEARMPQLKKVALAMGNTLIYTDTYEEGLAQLAGLRPSTVAAAKPVAQAPGQTVTAVPAPSGDAEKRLEALRNRFQRYRDLMSQGKWAEAGRELEAISGEIGKK